MTFHQACTTNRNQVSRSARRAAAVGTGAVYPDSSGELSFIRQVFEEWARAERTGAVPLTDVGVYLGWFGGVHRRSWWFFWSAA